MIAYLAGPITGKTFGDASEWRSDESGFVHWMKQIGVECRSPMRGKEKFVDRPDTVLTPYFDNWGEAVERDLADISEADLVVLNLLDAQAVSLGSMAEMGFAHAKGKPIITVVDSEDASIHTHPFVSYMSNHLCNDLEEALNCVQHVIANRVPYAPPPCKCGPHFADNPLCSEYPTLKQEVMHHPV